jgi:hypothetical protein
MTNRAHEGIVNWDPAKQIFCLLVFDATKYGDDGLGTVVAEMESTNLDAIMDMVMKVAPLEGAQYSLLRGRLENDRRNRGLI